VHDVVRGMARSIDHAVRGVCPALQVALTESE
jgi:hypothetical protein